jgi:hypothetical protein
MSNYYITFDAEVHNLAERLAALRNTNVSLGQRCEGVVQACFNADGDFDFYTRDNDLMNKLQDGLRCSDACAFILFVDGHDFGWSIWCDSPYEKEIFVAYVEMLLCALNLKPSEVLLKET